MQDDAALGQIAAAAAADAGRRAMQDGFIRFGCFCDVRGVLSVVYIY